MAIDPLELRNILLGNLSAAGFDTSRKTQDYWYALCKGLVTKFDSGGGAPDLTARRFISCPAGNVYSLCFLGSQLYVGYSYGYVYKQLESGAFSQQSINPGYFNCLCSHLGSVYAFKWGGDVYKQTNGEGGFVVLSKTSRQWRTACSIGDDLWVSVNPTNEYLYRQAGGSGGFEQVAGSGPANIRGIAYHAASNTIWTLNGSGSTGYLYYCTPGASVTWHSAGVSMPELNLDVQSMACFGDTLYISVAANYQYTVYALDLSGNYPLAHWQPVWSGPLTSYLAFASPDGAAIYATHGTYGLSRAG